MHAFVKKRQLWRINFSVRVTLKFDGWPRKTIGHLFYTASSFVRHFKSILVNSNWSYSLKTLNAGQKWRFFVPRDLEIWWMTLENNRALLQYYVKLCASFQIHQWIETGVTVRKRSTRVNISNLLSPVTSKIHGWPWKTIGHLFYTTLRFVHHIKAIGEAKLELQSGNAQFGSKLAIFFVSCDVEIWWMTLKNNRASLLYYAKLCASFQNHGWIQTIATVQKRPIWVNIGDFCLLWPWNLMDDIKKQ